MARRINLAYLLAVVCIGTSCADPHELGVGVNQAYYGYITSGEKFGVQIGDLSVESRLLLESGRFEYRGSRDCIELRRIVDCLEGQRYEIYTTTASIRNGVPVSHGHMRLEIGASGQVEGIVWRFYLLPSVDL